MPGAANSPAPAATIVPVTRIGTPYPLDASRNNPVICGAAQQTQSYKQQGCNAMAGQEHPGAVYAPPRFPFPGLPLP